VVAVSLSKPTVTRVGYLDLESEPRADATIGGRRVGSTPIRRYRLAAGPVVIQLRNTKLGLSKTLRLNIGAGETLRRRVVFRKGQVAFDVRPWADVYLGGRKLGTTPFPPISLYEGTYAVKLVNRDLGVERVVQVSVKSGKLKKVFEQLR
jgi:hypothetical protein